MGNDTCKKGYKGPLCEQCDIVNGYNSNGNECDECSTKIYVSFKFLLITFAILVLIGY